MRQQLGYLPQDFGIYPNLNAFEFLNYVAALKGVGGKGLKNRIQALLEGLNLMENAKNPLGTYSGGMVQRVGIAQALLNDPKVLIFDEPTVGLDPEERLRFRDLISDLSVDRIVMLSSHIVSDIESIADEVVIMEKGQLKAKGPQEKVKSLAANKVFTKTLSQDKIAAFKSEYKVVSSFRRNNEFTVRYIADTPDNESTETSATLEDAYISLTKG